MSQITPALVVDYVERLRQLPHPQLEQVAEEGRREGIPIVDAQTGALLHVLTRATGTRRALEIGTAIGYSTLWMATALPPDAMVITLERNQERAARARDHFARAGFGDRISVMIGDADRYLHKVAGPFDLIFQDGDKALYEPMLDRLLELLRPGGLLVTDNMLWDGEVVPGFVASPKRKPEDTAAIAHYSNRLVNDPRAYTTILPIGDGVAISVKHEGLQ